ncbi:ABC transporter ATP-binding protein [Pseudofrankia sp. DC12]|uniref:ABC transporter ATP-binding protein n=1 Tax=Pseudofrankia sp. DC12 TaxID=683315 RepID=UPI0005F8552E|nr:ABC transporter ATP-binding protein [Pseudofrankia sp. DC12]
MTTPDQTALAAGLPPATGPDSQVTPAGLVADVVVDLGAFTVQVALAVPPGEVTCVLGPNGAGKTTLLRALAGLTPISSGRIVLDGDTLDDPAAGVFRPAHRRPVGVVFQDYLLFPHLSARDNVAFGLRARERTGRREARQVADGWLDRLGLADHADRRPGQLSGGQAQRVALARALAPAPRLLLLDEPLAALDVATRSDVRAHLARALAAAPTPVLLVTHDPLDAMILADRIVILETGRIVQEGPAAEVARRPRTRYVARLVGLNLCSGTARGDLVTLDGGGQLHIPADSSPPGAGAAVLVAIRPTAVALHTGRPAQGSPRNVLPGLVETLEPFGDRVRVTIASDPPIHADITAAALADLRLAPGTPVWATIKATDLAVYPAQEG